MTALTSPLAMIGENPSMYPITDLSLTCTYIKLLGNAYEGTRMDTIWKFREGQVHIYYPSIISSNLPGNKAIIPLARSRIHRISTVLELLLENGMVWMNSLKIFSGRLW